MAPSPATEDYYKILEVDQNATSEQITTSYRRLALKLHPDRAKNAKTASTQAFQLLGLAYDTLKDASSRREYDLIYPSISRQRANARTQPQPPPPKPAPAAPSDAVREAAQIAAIRKAKAERAARWSVKRAAFESSIFEQRRGIRQLEQKIKDLASIAAAEAAVEARKNSWGTWFMSPLYKQVHESEPEKALKERARQERRIEKDLKERRLGVQLAQLKAEERSLETAKQEIIAADLCNDEAIQAIETKARDREARIRQERERVEAERQAKIRRQQQEQREKEAREAREAWEKQREEEACKAAERWKKMQDDALAAALAQHERDRRRQKIYEDEFRRQQTNYSHFTASNNNRNRNTQSSGCSHAGWWDKVHGRTACQECDEVWTYLLECPGCEMQACPKCQSGLRGRPWRGTARTSRREPPRPKAPSPNYSYDDYYDWD